MDGGVASAILPQSPVDGELLRSVSAVQRSDASTSTEGALDSQYTGRDSAVETASVSRVRSLNGWILPVTLNGVHTSALIDTGASTSVLSKAIFQAMPAATRSAVRADQEIIRGVGNVAMTPIGRMQVEIGIEESGTYPLEMVVSNANETAGWTGLS